MKPPRLLAVPLAAALLALGFAPALTAQDPVISRELTRIRRALPSPSSNQINFQNLNTANRALNGVIPSALRPPAGEFEFNSPVAPADEPQAPLDNLTPTQRSDLVATYQLHVQNLLRASKGNNVSVQEIANITSALEDLIRSLERLAAQNAGRELNAEVVRLTRIIRPPPRPQGQSPQSKSPKK